VLCSWRVVRAGWQTARATGVYMIASLFLSPKLATGSLTAATHPPSNAGNLIAGQMCTLFSWSRQTFDQLGRGSLQNDPLPSAGVHDEKGPPFRDTARFIAEVAEQRRWRRADDLFVGLHFSAAVSSRSAVDSGNATVLVTLVTRFEMFSGTSGSRTPRSCSPRPSSRPDRPDR
jgi:hypothetical protein